MRDVAAGMECDVIEFNGEANHVHLLIVFPPKVALADLVKRLKGVSSRLMRQEFAARRLRDHYRRANRLWSASYFAGSVGGAPLSIVKQYRFARTAGQTRVNQGRRFTPCAD